MAMILSSTAFQADHSMPTRFTCEGNSVSPALSWTGVPAGTRTLALIFDDPDAPNGVFTHWVLYNIPNGITSLPENASQNLPMGVMQGRNSYGNAQYDGPCPPLGSEHRYYFRLFAVDEKMDVMPGATRAQILDHIQKHGIENTELPVRFARSAATQQS